MAKLPDAAQSATPTHLTKFERIIPNGAEWNVVTADWLIIQLCEGIAYALGSKGNKDVPLGAVIICPPKSKMTLTASVLERALFRGIGLRLESLTGFLTALERKCLEKEVAQQCGPFITLAADHALARRMAPMFAQDQALTLAGRLAFTQWFAELITPQLQEAMSRGREDERSQQEAKDRLRWLLKEMPESELSRLSLSGLARQLHCCERHASRLFKEEWGTSFPAYVSDLRLKLACRLLAQPSLKIIDVALESGHGSLAHFNYVFKKRFQMTPTEWRERNLAPARSPSGRIAPRPKLASLAALLVWMLLSLTGISSRAAAATDSSTAPTNRPIRVDGYDVIGNTLLSTNVIDSVLAPYTGKINLDKIKDARGALRLEYFQRGFPTVDVILPPQTNYTSNHFIVTFEVVEGRVASVIIQSNRYFSSNNVLKAVPYVRTLLPGNRILNAKIFQSEVDLANANADRQIHPEVKAGLEPGTSALFLTIVDRLPLHGRLDLDNYSPPGTPELRINANASYGNLWDLDQTAGLQYGFSPERMKPSDGEGTHVSLYPLDAPEVTYYSGFYRAPLGEPADVESQIAQDPTHFGYNETTKQFVLPPASGRPEFSAFASRSTTGPTLFGPRSSVVDSSLLTIDKQLISQQYTSQTTVGARFSLPLPEWQGIHSTWSFGMDYKEDKVVTLPTNFFYYTTTVTNGNNSHAAGTTTHSSIGIAGVASFPSLQYTPFFVGWNGSRPDKWGQSASMTNRSSEIDGGVSLVAGTGGTFSRDRAFPILIANSKQATTEFIVIRPQLSRTQALPGNFTGYAGLSGQWANEPVLNLEQFELGGNGGIRGYREGELYADTGWMGQFEIRSPYYFRGAKGVLGAQFTLFTDYGQGYNLDTASEPLMHQDLWDVGAGINFRFGPYIESHILIGLPLLDSTFSVSGHERISFSLGAQL